MHPRRPESSSVLAICGGGNGAHAVAVIASETFDGTIVWLTSSEEKAARLRDGVFAPEGLRASGVVTGTAHRVRVINADPAAVIPQADLVLLLLPAFAHAPVLERIVPHLKAGAILGAMPSRSGLEFDLAPLLAGSQGYSRVVFGLQTLPWTVRVREVGRTVEVIGAKAEVFLAALPSDRAPGLASMLHRLTGAPVVPLPNFLNLTLGNPGQVIHPAGMYGLFSGQARTYGGDDIPRFYLDLNDRALHLMEAMSQEILEVARAVRQASDGVLDLPGVLSIGEWLRRSYAPQIGHRTSLGASFRTNSAYRSIMAPMREVAPGHFAPDFHHRFLADDVPFGLAVVKAIAEIVDTPTPGIDEVVGWAQEKLGKEYLVAGLLRGRDIPELRIPQNRGIASPADLVRFYL